MDDAREQRFIQEVTTLRTMIREAYSKGFISAHNLLELCHAHGIELSPIVRENDSKDWWLWTFDQVARTYMRGEIGDSEAAYLLDTDIVRARGLVQDYAKEQGIQDER